MMAPPCCQYSDAEAPRHYATGPTASASEPVVGTFRGPKTKPGTRQEFSSGLWVLLLGQALQVIE